VTLLLQFLIASALIALMILVRVFSGRHAIQQRLKCDRGDGNCSKTESFHGCSEHKLASDSESK
jgi:hypothetical protein